MQTATPAGSFPSNNKSILRTCLISVAYLLVSYILIGFKIDQLVLVALFISFFYISKETRKLIIGFSIFIVYWIIFDYMKAFPNYHYKTVDITDIYNLEKQFFGILQDGKVLTPNEYWRLKENNFLDVLSGVFYLTWVPVPLLFAVYLFFKNRKQFFYFSLTFLLVNLLGFVIYYVHPTAPPWFVQYYGFSFQPLKAGNTAGLAKFDLYFGLDIFKSIYAKGSNVFAAMPSLHSSYPVIVLFFALRNKMGYWNVIFFIVMVGIGFAAVYTSHHYILDVLAGIVTALIGIFIFQRILKRTKWLNAFVNILLDATK